MILEPTVILDETAARLPPSHPECLDKMTALMAAASLERKAIEASEQLQKVGALAKQQIDSNVRTLEDERPTAGDDNADLAKLPPATGSPPPVKRGRGRPRGSGNGRGGAGMRNVAPIDIEVNEYGVFFL
jgi:hypothetical protein